MEKSEFKDRLQEYRKRIDKRLLDFLREKRKTIVNKGIYDLLMDFALRGGKRLRSVLMIEAYKAVGGRNVDETERASISMELLEDYLLIHDDIIDKDDTRRGGASFHKMVEKKLFKDAHFGVSSAIVMGDVLSALSISPILESSFSPELKLKATKEIVSRERECYEGQLLDIILEKTERVKEEDFFKMIDLKTSSYTTLLPLTLGGLFGEGTDIEVDSLKKYGELIGRAFQIRDDILGTFGDEQTGKPTDSDIKQGKKTLLVIYTLENGSKYEKAILLNSLGKSNVDIEKVRKVMRKSGALSYSQEKVVEFTNEAKSILIEGGFSHSIDFLLTLADFLRERVA